jgi:hypothetical protein
MPVSWVWGFTTRDERDAAAAFLRRQDRAGVPRAIFK